MMYDGARMARKDKKKRQHYVPRLVLRNFSFDGRRVSLALVKDGTRHDDVSLRDQCYSDYFYGKAPDLEDAFSDQEGRLAALLGDLDPVRLEQLTDENLAEVKFFVHYQRQRTVAAAAMTEDTMDALFRKVASMDPRVRDIDLSKYRLKLTMPQLDGLAAAAEAMPLVADLKVKFLVNDTRVGFVISDAPVATYNQWAEHHPKFRGYGGYKGVATKGLQWFYPVSPAICVAVYDPTTYEYGRRHRRLCRAGKHDVALLNSLQALHARDCVYFRKDLLSNGELSQLMGVRAAHPPLSVPEVREMRATTVDDSRVREILNPRAPDARIGARFHFVRVIERETYRDYDLLMLPVRSPELFAAYQAQRAARDRVLELQDSPAAAEPS